MAVATFSFSASRSDNSVNKSGDDCGFVISDRCNEKRNSPLKNSFLPWQLEVSHFGIHAELLQCIGAMHVCSLRQILRRLTQALLVQSFDVIHQCVVYRIGRFKKLINVSLNHISA